MGYFMLFPRGEARRSRLIRFVLVDPGWNFAAVAKASNVLGDDFGRRFFVGRRAAMRQHADARMSPRPVIFRQRLMVKNVQNGVVDSAAIERRAQIFSTNNRPA